MLKIIIANILHKVIATVGKVEDTIAATKIAAVVATASITTTINIEDHWAIVGNYTNFGQY